MPKTLDLQTKMKVANTAASSVGSVGRYLEGGLRRPATVISITRALKRLHMSDYITQQHSQPNPVAVSCAPKTTA
jgi:hypothetical protein